jgi:hypothetical protein
MAVGTATTGPGRMMHATTSEERFLYESRSTCSDRGSIARAHKCAQDEAAPTGDDATQIAIGNLQPLSLLVEPYLVPL